MAESMNDNHVPNHIFKAAKKVADNKIDRAPGLYAGDTKVADIKHMEYSDKIMIIDTETEEVRLVDPRSVHVGE